jgi:16S rRNA (cytidine1402-2'-O)-methyltransferase
LNKQLYIIPSLISQGDKDLFFPPKNAEILKSIDFFFVENLRTARRFLRYIDTTFPINDKTFLELDKHYSVDKQVEQSFSDSRFSKYGLISEAGYPAIADPGSSIVLKAHQDKIEVIPLIGPSSLFLALASSGLNGQHFEFHGYLPVKSSSLNQKIKQLEAESGKQQKTQIFIETPYRNQSLFLQLLNTLNKNTLLCVACNVGGSDAFISTKTIAQWNNIKQNVDIHKKPAVFLIQA